MCGIAGLLDRSATTHAEHLAQIAGDMADAVTHRGPDDFGTWVDAATGVAFGHRRLSIVDLSETGCQPMSSASGRYVIAFNGELYDHGRLRRQLEQLGHRFRGTSDTEVLLAAIEEWGGLEEALRRCNAMFAIALWDRRERRLLLARDRLGEKPIYYGTIDDHVIFGSELKALRRHPSFHGEVDRRALALYLRHTYVPSPHSIYRGVQKLPPGTILTIDPSADRALGEPVPFWSLRETVEQGVADPFPGSSADAVEALDGLLRDAVALRLQADVPVGAFLSGGVDSSLVVALAQAAGGTAPVRTFTIAMPDLDLDESAEAAAVARHLGTDHTSVAISSADALDLVPRLPTLYDEPFSDPSQLPMLLLSAVAREQVTVALSGDGGDESFGGYNRHVFGPMAWQRMQRIPPGLRSIAARAILAVRPEHFDRVGRRAGALHAKLGVGNVGDKAHKLAHVLGVSGEHEVYISLVSQWDDPAALVGTDGEPSTAANDPSASPLGISSAERMLFLDTVMALGDGMLTKVDRATMSVGLEGRLPLLDHRVVELAWRLPMSMKIQGGRGKWILREVLDRYVPRDLIERPKMGFDPPIGAWLRGPLRAWADDLLDPGVLRGQGWIDPDPVCERWDEHQRGTRNWDYHLWTVLQFQSWLAAT